MPEIPPPSEIHRNRIPTAVNPGARPLSLCHHMVLRLVADGPEITMMPPLPDFVRRPKSDGTTDSICTRCFLTVATATWEADLDSAEQGHECNPWRLENLRKSVKRSDAAGDSPQPLQKSTLA